MRTYNTEYLEEKLTEIKEQGCTVVANELLRDVLLLYGEENNYPLFYHTIGNYYKVMPRSI